MIEVELPDGTVLEFPEGMSQGDIKSAIDKKFGQSPEVLHTTDDGGVVTRSKDGNLSFSSPAYSTNDPAKIQEIMGGKTPGDVSISGFDQQTIDQAPITSRAVKAVEGVPLVGSRVDEAAGALFGDEARDGVRAVSGAMAREKPGQSTALGLGGAIAGSVPMAIAAAPLAAYNTATTLGGNAIRYAAAGLGIGATEGAIYGSGEGTTGQERKENAQEGAVFGGMVGGVLGAAAPYASEAVKQTIMQLKGSDIGLISKTLGISAPAARVIKNAIDAGDSAAAVKALQQAGPNRMLADAGQPAQQLLDAATQTGGAAGRIASDAVEERVTGASADLVAAMDNTLGKPQGIKAMQKDIRTSTAQPRDAAYDDAYSKPINYAAPRGRALESFLKNVPRAAIKDANELMRVNGEESAQIIAKIGDDGAVTFETMPDVRQIDYITRALNGVADKADGQGKLGGQTPLGRAYRNLSRNIRNTLKGEVPEYAKALDVAADAISRKNATDTGYSLLRAGTTRDDVASALSGASRAERDAMKQGVRSYIDDMTANVKTALTDNNRDAREALKALREMSSRANREKLRAVIGKKSADKLFDEIDTATVAFELRAALAQNSKTAIRQSIQGSVSQEAAPGMLETLASGEVVNASKRFVQIFTGSSDEAKAIRASGIYEEIATVLTQTRGRKADQALKIVNRAMSGQRVSEQQAAFVGNVIAGSAFLAGNREASQRLSTQ